MDHNELERKIVSMSQQSARERKKGVPDTSREDIITNDSQAVQKKDGDHHAPISEADLKKEIAGISRVSAAINEKLNEFIVGNQEVIDLILIALFNEGHILIEGIPGTGKPPSQSLLP